MVKNDCVSLVDTRIIYSVEEAVAHLEEMVSLGLEGTVLKDGDGIWEDKTSKNCIKLKIVADGIDLEIIGYTEGKNKNKELFGSVMCQSSDGLLRVNISGFTDDMRLYIHNNRERLIGTIMTVKANSITVPSKNNEYYSLFLPRFEELREGDKDVADDLGRIQEIFKVAVLDVKQQLLDAMK
jgi:DNA ligase-1